MKIGDVLRDSGFSKSQVESLLDVFALKGHSHEIEDITGLDEELEYLEDVAEPVE